MKRLTTIIAGVGSLVVGIALYAWAQGTTTPGRGPGFVDSDGDGVCDCGRPMSGRMGKGGGGTGLGLGAVKLTPEQQAQVDKLRADHQQTASSLRTALRTRQEELDGLMKATQPDRKAIDAKIDEVNAARSQLQKEKASYQVSVRNLLTPEQLAALDARGAGAGMGLGRGMGKGRGAGMGGRGQGQGPGFVDADKDGVCDRCGSSRTPRK